MVTWFGELQDGKSTTSLQLQSRYLKFNILMCLFLTIQDYWSTTSSAINGSVASSKVESQLADARVYMLTHPKEFDMVHSGMPTEGNGIQVTGQKIFEETEATRFLRIATEVTNS